jgi:hypothetical protein
MGLTGNGEGNLCKSSLAGGETAAQAGRGPKNLTIKMTGCLSGPVYPFSNFAQAQAKRLLLAQALGIKPAVSLRL